jgi:hypothetical protein
LFTLGFLAQRYVVFARPGGLFKSGERAAPSRR